MLRHEQLRQIAREINSTAQAIAILSERQRRQVTIIQGIASELEEEIPGGSEDPPTSA